VELSGQFSTFYVAFFRFGYLVAYTMGIGLPRAKLDIDYSKENYWRIMLGFPIALVITQVTLLILVFPLETPKYLFMNNKIDECKEALNRIYIDQNTIDTILQKLQEYKSSASTPQISYSELFNRTYIRAFIVALILNFCLQLGSGNAVMIYSSSIFKKAHATESTALIGTIILGAVTVDGVFSYSLIVDGIFI